MSRLPLPSLTSLHLGHNHLAFLPPTLTQVVLVMIVAMMVVMMVVITVVVLMMEGLIAFSIPNGVRHLESFFHNI